MNDCPLSYRSNNAPDKRDVLGSFLLSILSGHTRYAHIASIANDTVNTQLLGMTKVVSDDSARRALQKIDEHKESGKWVEASQAVAERMQEHQQHGISVCDREADVIEYLNNKHQQRFLVRAKTNRYLETGELLFDYVGALQEAGKYRIHIPQRGGRLARKARLSLRFASVRILPPAAKRDDISAFELTAIICEEKTTDDAALKWVLLTSEPVENSEQARQIVAITKRVGKSKISIKSGKLGEPMLKDCD